MVHTSLRSCHGLEASGVVTETLFLVGGTASSDITVTVIPYDLGLGAKGKRLPCAW